MLDEKWMLVWEDDFDGEEGDPINEENWTCEIGGQGWGNREWEYYTDRPENVSLNGESLLVINAQEEEDFSEGRCWYGNCKYTSARCITHDKFAVTYGRIEARIKVPFGQGIWPAFWMLGENFGEVGWPNSGEIDIMEFIGREPKTVYGTVHGPGYSGADGVSGNIVLEEDISDDFHVFAIEWEPEEIRWYLDGEEYHRVTPASLHGSEWVFDHDFFILLNLAVGGNWPGYPDDTTIFPQQLLVDYVRVYQQAETANK
ncbi:MAG: glycoside hydrolase family 16 protein [Anaerolineae bacterium]|nr:glycoside hydrolase family 16 protein [Anaerolineae bacterium]